jgi:hypothetical protein
MANMANKPFLFPTLNTDVAFSYLTPCGAINIRAKYFLWVHWSSSYGLIAKSLPMNPIFCKPHFLPAGVRPPTTQIFDYSLAKPSEPGIL